MKSRIITTRIRVWCCDDPEHRHRAKEVAAACIRKSSEKAMAKAARPVVNSWTHDALLALEQRRIKGETPAELAFAYGISKPRIYQLLQRAWNIRSHKDKLAEILASRTGELKQWKAEHGSWPLRLYPQDHIRRALWTEYKEDGTSIDLDLGRNYHVAFWMFGDVGRRLPIILGAFEWSNSRPPIELLEGGVHAEDWVRRNNFIEVEAAA